MHKPSETTRPEPSKVSCPVAGCIGTASDHPFADPSKNLHTQPGKPLQKERWAAVVDSVGSHTLANACAQTRYRGLVAACGLAQGMDFPSSVAPFILRGVSLLGIDSVMAPRELRQPAWDRLARDLDGASIDRISSVIGLSEAPNAAQNIVSGHIRGRVVVDVNR